MHRSLLLAVVAISPVGLFAQGSLTPAGAPAPTMKTLSQIEARTAVQSLPGDATHLHVISQSGSYYLTGNLEGVAGKAGIKIAAVNVTLDLRGFTLKGVDGTLDAIAITTNGGPIVIENGILQYWGGGGIIGRDATHSTVRNVTVLTTKSGAGIWLGNGSSAENCTVYNTCAYGIKLGIGSLARGSVVRTVGPWSNPEGDTYTAGIDAATVVDCTVEQINSGPTLTGMTGIEGMTVVNCTVRDINGAFAGSVNGISARTVRGCTVEDFEGGGDNSAAISGSLVQENTVQNVTGSMSAGIRNNGFGAQIIRNRVLRGSIVVGGACHVLENSVSLDGTGTGIHVSGLGNRVEGNQVGWGAIGIHVVNGNNFLARNFVWGSATRYSIAAGNQAPIAVVSADDITPASPWANFSQ